MTSENPEAVSLYRQKDQGLSWDSRFRFHCHGGLDCFNRCCRTPTILLSPYDILRLKQFLGLASREFLERYTRREIDQWSHLPLIFLDPFKTEEPGCPFLGAEGCTVYAHRPAACRLFPITMGSQMTEQGMADHYFCRQLDYCQGFAGGREWTLESWIADQGFEEYDDGRREWLEILLKMGLKGPREIDAELLDLFALASYDLDQFRQDLSEWDFLQVAVPGVVATDDLVMDDLALLHFSYRYLRDLLLGDGEEG
jgi:Fe-S-cluster containining protein